MHSRPSVDITIVQLALEASVEINVPDLKDLDASRSFLAPGRKVHITFLPKQTWAETESACRAVRQAGFDPVPHVPVRLLRDAKALDHVVSRLVSDGRAEELLLLSGDCPEAVGPYTCVEDVLSTGVLSKYGLHRVSFAGHPEGHPKVPIKEIRRAEKAISLQATASGLDVSLVTQFFFEPEPFLAWAQEIQESGVKARLVAGLAGPARISTLLKFALRCGAGPSIRALGARPTAFAKLLGDHGPQNVLRSLAEAQNAGTANLGGIHLFCFGGFLRTCQWLHRLATGEFRLNSSGGFDIE